LRHQHGLIVGYVTLSAAQIEREYLAKVDRRNKRNPLPATLLGQLAVDKAYQRKGHARSLLLFAMMTALRASHEAGALASSPIRLTIRFASFIGNGDLRTWPLIRSGR